MVVAPTTSVKTTSVNIASVTPVRKRLRSGYATDIRSTGASALIRPNDATSPPSRTSALYMIVQVAPTTIIRPPKRKIEKSTFRSPKSQRLTGSTNQTTSASPAAVFASRSGTPSSRTSGTRLRITSEAPSPSTTPCFALTPENMNRAPRTSPATASSQRRLRFSAAGGSGRLRIAVEMFIRLTRPAEKATTAKVSSTPTA